MRFDLNARYEHPGLGDDHSHDQYALAKMATAKWVGALLERTYPGHPWHVEVIIQRGTGTHAGGVVKIRLNGIMPGNYWYTVNMSELLNDPGGKRVLKACGELLERYGIRRGAFNLDDWRNALNAMPVSVKNLGKGHRAPLID